MKACWISFFSQSAPSILHGAGGPNVRVCVRSWEEKTQAVGHGLPFPDTVKYPTQCKKLCHADTEPAALRLQANLKVALAKFVSSRCKPPQICFERVIFACEAFKGSDTKDTPGQTFFVALISASGQQVFSSRSKSLPCFTAWTRQCVSLTQA